MGKFSQVQIVNLSSLCVGNITCVVFLSLAFFLEVYDLSPIGEFV